MPDCGIEVLIPDFKGRKQHPRDSLATVIDARPDVLAHNLETVSATCTRASGPASVTTPASSC